VSVMGGVMRCVDEIRGDGVAPVPVADACLHSQQVTAESCPPLSHNHDCCVLTRVNKASGSCLKDSYSRSCAASVYQPKNAREFEGSALKVFSARSALLVFLSLPTTRLIVTREPGCKSK
jgi:hypothetical protein